MFDNLHLQLTVFDHMGRQMPVVGLQRLWDPSPLAQAADISTWPPTFTAESAAACASGLKHEATQHHPTTHAT